MTEKEELELCKKVIEHLLQSMERAKKELEKGLAPSFFMRRKKNISHLQYKYLTEHQ